MAKKRLTRKQLLKEPDEFITTTGKILQWAQDHTRQLILGGAVFLGLVILFVAINYYNAVQNRSATALYGQILEKHQSAGGESEAVKSMAAVREDLKKLVETYGSQSAGKLGRIKYGHFALASGDLDEAVAQFQSALKYFKDDPSLVNVIRNGLGTAYDQKGEYPAAVEQFETLAQSSSPVLKDAALFHLGRLYDQLGRSEESQKVYRQLRTDFADTTYAQLVQDRGGE